MEKRKERWVGRVKRAWRALRGDYDMSCWTPEQVDAVNYEMAEGIISEMGEVLERFGCDHGHDMKDTPPMMYPEAMVCALKHAAENHAKPQR